jgi:hypothetical protein
MVRRGGGEAYAVFVFVEPGHEGEDAPENSGHETDAEEAVSREGVASEAVVHDGAYACADQPMDMIPNLSILPCV